MWILYTWFIVISMHPSLSIYLSRLANSHGSQCGFCTPGIVMSMYTLLRNNPLPTMKEMETYFQVFLKIIRWLTEWNLEVYRTVFSIRYIFGLFREIFVVVQAIDLFWRDLGKLLNYLIYGWPYNDTYCMYNVQVIEV